MDAATSGIAAWGGSKSGSAMPEAGGAFELGDCIRVRQDGQGPLTPARLTGTVSLIPQAGQAKIIESGIIL
jgi:hypothetical protein